MKWMGSRHEQLHDHERDDLLIELSFGYTY